MRVLTFFALFLLLVGFSAIMASRTSAAGEAPVEIKINGSQVHIRKGLPQTDRREDGEPYADPRATYLAYERKEGRVAGYSGFWIRVVNKARDEERGWVASPYVQAGDAGDERRLEQLGYPHERNDALLQIGGNVAGIIQGLWILWGAVGVGLGWQKLVRQRKANRVSRPTEPPIGNTGPFPRVVPPLPVSSPSSSPESAVIYGTGGGGSFWIHRRKKSQ